MKEHFVWCWNRAIGELKRAKTPQEGVRNGALSFMSDWKKQEGVPSAPLVDFVMAGAMLKTPEGLIQDIAGFHFVPEEYKIYRDDPAAALAE